MRTTTVASAARAGRVPAQPPGAGRRHGGARLRRLRRAVRTLPRVPVALRCISLALTRAFHALRSYFRFAPALDEYVRGAALVISHAGARAAPPRAK